MSRANRFELITSPDSEVQIGEVADILNERNRKQGRVTFVTTSEAIRYAISFTHKQLTEVLNPEDLHDD